MLTHRKQERVEKGATSESADREAAAVSMTISAPALPPSPPLHALDLAPVNSKIVATLGGAVLATPERVELLPPGDPAHRLPEGAKIQKVAEHVYRASELRSFYGHDAKDYETATAAIQDFLTHFHEVQT
jgi:hypothetical protein